MRYHYFALVAQGSDTAESFEEFTSKKLEHINHPVDYFQVTTLEEADNFKEICPRESELFPSQAIVAEFLISHDGERYDYVKDVLKAFPENSRRIRHHYVRKFTPRQARKKGLTELVEEA